VKELLFSADGRINRGKYWGAFFGLILANFAALTLVLIFRMAFDDAGYYASGVVYLIFTVGVAVSWIMVSIKRWHDRGKSGWWILIALVPLIGQLGVIIECGFLIGEGGPNQYGPDPLASIGR
jgi:uncharacterized membrane protein YhaH (DUF805 family)